MSTPSAWRNAIPRRMYRERRQLHSREHLGMLEKKRDYKKRSKDYHDKANIISEFISRSKEFSCINKLFL
jgi:U3 small nucleolar RNA-associated protein 11